MGLIYDREGCTFFALPLGESGRLTLMVYARYSQGGGGREKDAYLFVRVRKKERSFGVHRQDGRKADIHLLFIEDCQGRLMQWWLQGYGRSKKMPCHEPGATQCLHHGQGA